MIFEMQMSKLIFDVHRCLTELYEGWDHLAWMQTGGNAQLHHSCRLQQPDRAGGSA